MKLRGYYVGYVTAIENGVVSYRFMSPVTNERFDAKIELSKIEPNSERNHAEDGGLFRIAIRHKATFKFFKSDWTRQSWRRRLNRVHRRIGKLDLFK